MVFPTGPGGGNAALAVGSRRRADSERRGGGRAVHHDHRPSGPILAVAKPIAFLAKSFFVQLSCNSCFDPNGPTSTYWFRKG